MDDLSPTAYRIARLQMREFVKDSARVDSIFMLRHRIVAQLEKLGIVVPDTDEELAAVFTRLLEDAPEKLTPWEIIEEVG